MAYINSFRVVNNNHILNIEGNSLWYSNGTNRKHLYYLLSNRNLYNINSVVHNGITITVGEQYEYSFTGQDFIRRVIAIMINHEGILMAAFNGTTIEVPVTQVRLSTPANTQPVTINIPPATPATPTTTSLNDQQLNTIQQNIINSFNGREIRFPGLVRNRPETLREFIIRFFNEWNNEKDTIYKDNREVQTTAGRRRSLGDIFMICRYYYQNCTLREVVDILYRGNLQADIEGFRTSYCHTIHKRVWYSNPELGNGIYDRTIIDEFGFIYDHY